MYSLNDFRRYQALQSLPLLSDQCLTELMDKMLILLFEDKFEQICTLESISGPSGMAHHADKLWMICGRSVPIQVLSDQFEDMCGCSAENLQIALQFSPCRFSGLFSLLMSPAHPWI